MLVKQVEPGRFYEVGAPVFPEAVVAGGELGAFEHLQGGDGLHLGEFGSEGVGHATGYAGVVLNTGGVVGLGDDAVDVVVGGLLGVEGGFKTNDHEDDQGSRDTDGKTSDVERGRFFEPEEVADGDFQHGEGATRMVPGPEVVIVRKLWKENVRIWKG